MPEGDPAEGIVTRSELAELAELFDRFEFAIDPLSLDAAESEANFNTRIEAIFEERVRPVIRTCLLWYFTRA